MEVNDLVVRELLLVRGCVLLGSRRVYYLYPIDLTLNVWDVVSFSDLVGIDAEVKLNHVTFVILFYYDYIAPEF